MPLFEVRVPTYRRPEMLRRALQSVQAQSEEDWAVFVFDDSVGLEGAEVVRSLDDARIHYRPNGVNLGAARNIDQVFRKTPHTAAQFFTILSDDNLLGPDFLSRGRNIAQTSGCNVILLNETVVDANGRPVGTGVTTRGGWFDTGKIEPFDLYATLLLKEGISDGGLFWTRNAASDFEVGSDMSEVCLQEACRTLKVAEPIYFDETPAAAFSLLPQDKVVRQTRGSRVVTEGRAAIVRYLRRRGGRKIITHAERFAERMGLTPELQTALESALRPWEGRGLGPPDLKQRLRNVARAFVTPNPVRKFLLREPGVFHDPSGQALS